MANTASLLPTTVVGSYPQPDWLVNRQMLSKVVPRTRMREIWRVPEAFLEQAQDDATLIAMFDRGRTTRLDLRGHAVVHTAPNVRRIDPRPANSSGGTKPRRPSPDAITPVT